MRIYKDLERNELKEVTVILYPSNKEKLPLMQKYPGLRERLRSVKESALQRSMDNPQEWLVL